MRSHRIDRVLVDDNVCVEIFYESNPYFFNESVSLVLRLKHLGSLQEKEALDLKLNQLSKNKDVMNSPNKSSFIDSILSVLSQEQNHKDKQNLKSIDHTEKLLKFHDSVDLVSCYIQIFGTFEFDTEIIDKNRLDKVTTLIPHVEDSMDYDELGTRKEGNNNGSLTISDFFNTNIRTLNNTLQDTGSHEGQFEKIPLLLIPQTLLFTELSLHPGEVKTFHFKSPILPCDLPPSYTISKTFSINYSLRFGLTKISSIKEPENFNFNFPLYIYSYVDPKGNQFTSKLDSGPKLLEVGNAKALLSESVKNPLFKSPKPEKIMQNQDPGEYKSKFKSLVTDFINNNGKADVEYMIEQLVNLQFDGVTEYNENDKDKLDDGFKYSARDNISNLYNTFQEISKPISEPVKMNLSPQLQNLKKEFIINRNGECICKINLGKPFYLSSDQIDFVIEFPVRSLKKVTGIYTSLESYELINPVYNLDKSENKHNNSSQIAYVTHSICFDKCKKISLKLVPQQTPTKHLPAQFESNIFQLKWRINFKLVLVDIQKETLLSKFYQDINGSLHYSKSSLEGEEFIFDIPLTILPTNQQYGGW